MTELVSTRWGAVEVQWSGSGSRTVILLPGGHCTAATDIGQDLYTDLGYRTVSVSRPGYGRTDVGPLTFAEFTPVLGEVCRGLGLTEIAAVVGVSFGGQQAIRLAGSGIGQRLVLHSCAPSGRPYPVGRDRVLTPAAFGPGERLTWAAVRRLVRSDRGIRLMMSGLSTTPPAEWFGRWTPDDRLRARRTFSTMRSGTGFLLDVRQGVRSLTRHRLTAQQAVDVPTLVTASRQDAGAPFAHAQDLAATIPGAELVETGAESHFYWIGPHRRDLAGQLAEFLER